MGEPDNRIMIRNIELVTKKGTKTYHLPMNVTITNPADTIFPLQTLYELLCQFTLWYPNAIKRKPSLEELVAEALKSGTPVEDITGPLPNEICGFLLPFDIDEVDNEYPGDFIHVAIIDKIAKHFKWMEVDKDHPYTDPTNMEE